jgi:hypothetical protein
MDKHIHITISLSLKLVLSPGVNIIGIHDLATDQEKKLRITRQPLNNELNLKVCVLHYWAR